MIVLYMSLNIADKIQYKYWNDRCQHVLQNANQIEHFWPSNISECTSNHGGNVWVCNVYTLCLLIYKILKMDMIWLHYFIERIISQNAFGTLICDTKISAFQIGHDASKWIALGLNQVTWQQLFFDDKLDGKYYPFCVLFSCLFFFASTNVYMHHTQLYTVMKCILINC